MVELYCKNITRRVTVDNFRTPVIITDPNGRIKYKNNAAKHCIPYPRVNANIKINHRLEADLFYDTDDGNVALRCIKNDKSIFNRAIVTTMPNCNDRLWLFCYELQLMEAEELAYARPVFSEIAEAMVSTLDLYREQKPLSFDRYRRLGEEMLKAVKYLAPTPHTERFFLSRILSSLKEGTLALAEATGFRICFEGFPFSPFFDYYFSYRAFAVVYIQLLSTVLRISKNKQCTVSAGVRDLELILTVEADIPPCRGIYPNATIFDLIKEHSEEALNLLMLEQTVKRHGYILRCKLEDERLLISVRCSLQKYIPDILRSGLPDYISQIYLSRVEKRNLYYFEGMLY